MTNVITATIPTLSDLPVAFSDTPASKRRVLRSLPRSAVTFGATPDPVPSWWVRALLEKFHCGQCEAARLLRYDARTVRRWVNPADGITPTWAACELLRRLLVERGGAAVTSAHQGNVRSPV